MNTQMLEEMLGHLAAARDDDAVRVLVLSSTDHMGLSAGADVREELDADGRVRRMELFAQLYDELTGFPKPTIAACHGSCVGGGAEVAVACDLRVGGSNLRLRFPGGALGVPVGPARLVTPVRPLGREVPAADRQGGRRRRRRSAGASSTASPRPPPPRRPRSSSRRRSPQNPPEAVATPQADAPRVGRRRGPLARRGRGPGRVAALRPRPPVSASSRRAA